MPAAHIAAALAALAGRPDLLAEASFARRAQVLDELEVHVLDRLDTLPAAAAAELRRRARALQARLEQADQRLFRRLRADIRAGRYEPAGLRARLLADAGPGRPGPATGYDALDTLTNGLFPEPAGPLEAAGREPEMVYYQKTPARIILELAPRLTPADTLYDLGSGLGQVPLLLRLLSGATTRGVEIEPAYCLHARACAEALGLGEVTFLQADARTADYADATAFYFFTPFTGGIMRQVLARLQRLARQRPLRLFSYGPSTEALRQQVWLRQPAAESHLYHLAEFESR